MRNVVSGFPQKNKAGKLKTKLNKKRHNKFSQRKEFKNEKNGKKGKIKILADNIEYADNSRAKNDRIYDNGENKCSDVSHYDYGEDEEESNYDKNDKTKLGSKNCEGTDEKKKKSENKEECEALNETKVSTQLSGFNNPKEKGCYSNEAEGITLPTKENDLVIDLIRPIPIETVFSLFLTY